MKAIKPAFSRPQAGMIRFALKETLDYEHLDAPSRLAARNALQELDRAQLEATRRGVRT